uniref:Calpain 5 n=1 Tax=Eptatretus burgeri TaxID=7764 RepID=A0A8C4X095_EPTBU
MHWKKVIPEYQKQEWDPDQEKYCGIFHFRFWRFGKWMDVVIDDRLPSHGGKLLFCHSLSENEFWSALLEKAYAKLAGCYEALDGGNTADALVDFTGGVSQSIDLLEGGFSEDEKAAAELFAEMEKAHSRGALLSCSIRATTAAEMEARMDTGLVKGHAYSVTDVRRVRLGEGFTAFFKSEKLNMIRMRNPWGAKEWNGPWSDESEEWNRVGHSELQRLGMTVENDGEFWMSFDDWYKYFTDAIICRIINTSVMSIHKTWEEVMLVGQWRTHADPLQNRAGGCRNNRSTFLQNPQFMFDVTKDHDTIMINLQQKDKRHEKKHGGGEALSIGFEVFSVEQNREYRMHSNQDKVEGSEYINSCSVFRRMELKKGRYVILPTTFDPNLEGDFLIRVFADVKSHCRELIKDQPDQTCWTGLCGYPSYVTSIHLIKTLGLPGSDISPLAKISCGGEKVKSSVLAGSSPEFETKGLFYHKKPNKPIIIEVLDHGLIQSDTLGRVEVPADVTEEKSFIILQLRSKEGRDAGKVHLWVHTRTELTDI